MVATAALRKHKRLSVPPLEKSKGAERDGQHGGRRFPAQGQDCRRDGWRVRSVFFSSFFSSIIGKLFPFSCRRPRLGGLIQGSEKQWGGRSKTHLRLWNLFFFFSHHFIGIGLAIVKLAAARGARIVVADLRLGDEAEAFVKSSSQALGGAVVFQECDVSKRSDLERLVEVSRGRWGSVPDVYISSAGLFEPVG